MARFKALPGQEGDPYIAEFRLLDHSKIPTFWLENYGNGYPKMPHEYAGGFIVQRDAKFDQDRQRTDTLRQRELSAWETRKTAKSQALRSGRNDRRSTRSSSGGSRPATQVTMAQGDETEDAIVLAPYTERRSEAESSTMQPDDPEESLQTEPLPEITFCDCPKDHTSKQHSKSGMARLRPNPNNRSEGPNVSSQTPTADLLDRCKSCRSCGKPKVAQKDRDSYKRQMQEDRASQRDGRSQTGKSRKKKVPSAATTAQHLREPEATENSSRDSRGFFARFTNDVESLSDGKFLPANSRKRKRNHQSRKQSTSSFDPETSPGVEVPIAAQQQSPEASSSDDDGATPNLDHRPGKQANRLPSTARFDSRIGATEEDSPIQLARNSPIQPARDSTVQSAENSHIQVEEEEPLSRASGSSSILERGDRQLMHESGNGLVMQRAATANMTSGVDDADNQIGLATHPTEVSNPHKDMISSQQTHMPVEHNAEGATRPYAENATKRANTTLDLPTSSSLTEHDREANSTGVPQQQLHPTGKLHNTTAAGHSEQAHNNASFDCGQERRGEQYATPASSDGHHQERDSGVPDQRTSANTPAPSVESVKSSKEWPAPQGDVIDLTNSDDDSPSSAIKPPAEETAMNSTDKKREIEDALAKVSRDRRRLQIKRDFDVGLIDLEEEEEGLLRQKRQLSAGRIVKSEPKSGFVKTEQ